MSLSILITLSWDEVQRSIYKIIGDFGEFCPEVIVGIPRGGSIVSVLISYSLLREKGINVDTTIYPRYPIKYDNSNQALIEEDISALVKGKSVLIADDGVFTGGTLLSVKRKIESEVEEIRTASICYNKHYAIISVKRFDRLIMFL
jgi:hypoxanthine phosphoribosyltransferase